MSKLPPLVLRDEFAKDDGQPSDESQLLPVQLWLHIINYSHIIMMNRPAYARSKKFSAASRPTPPPPQTGSSGTGRSSDLEGVRDRCFEAAKEIVRLVGLFRKVSGSGLQVAINTMHHSLTNAATILILESSNPSADVSAHELNRREEAQRLLDEGAFLYMKEMAASRPSAQRSLTNLKAMVRDRDDQDRKRSNLAAKVAATKTADGQEGTTLASQFAMAADDPLSSMAFSHSIPSTLPAPGQAPGDSRMAGTGSRSVSRPSSSIDVAGTGAVAFYHPPASASSASGSINPNSAFAASFNYDPAAATSQGSYMPYPTDPGSLAFYQEISSQVQPPPEARPVDHAFYPSNWAESVTGSVLGSGSNSNAGGSAAPPGSSHGHGPLHTQGQTLSPYHQNAQPANHHAAMQQQQSGFVPGNQQYNTDFQPYPSMPYEYPGNVNPTAQPSYPPYT